MLSFIEMLQVAIDNEASDVFIVAGQPLSYKKGKSIYTMEEEKVMPATSRALVQEAYQIANRDISVLDRSGDDDFAISVPNMARLRMCTFKQRGSLGAVLRVVSFGIPDYRKLNIPEEVMKLADTQKGMILVTGTAGSGKSTILNLLLRLYDPDSGTIYIDGQDIRTIPYEQLRSKVGVVFQNDFVMEGTIADNLRFFRDLNEEALDRAAEDAQAEFIQQKEGQMNAEVMVRGNNLSGGQKQRLLIGRALAANPEILILDDASSALDYRTDANLRRALRQNHRDTTTVLVAQRVSSLRHADLILVLSDGAVIGAGDHDHLMEVCDEYRIIAETQMGDGKEGA